MTGWACLFFCLPLAGLFAQDDEKNFVHQDYDWEAAPSWQAIDSLQVSAIIRKDFQALEYAHTHEQLYLFETRHKIIQINDDEGVASYARVYLPFRQGDELLKLKVRSVDPRGKVTELDDSMIREISEPGNVPAFYTHRSYRIFAVEGVTKGGYIEYLYSIRRAPELFDRRFVQSEVPIYDFHFELISPNFLLFQLKGYNAFPDTSIAVDDDRLYYKADTAYLPGLKPEKYANYRNALARAEWGFFRNLNMPGKRLYSWESAAQHFHELFMESEDRTLKKLRKHLRKEKLDQGSGRERLLNLEEHIKTNYTLQRGEGESFEDPLEIIENKYANQSGLIRLYCHFFRSLEYEYQLVLTCERTSSYFDEDYNGWNYLQDVLFYFPDIDAYIDPLSVFHRLGYAGESYIGNSGLFISELTLGEVTTPSAQIREIGIPPRDRNFHDLEITVKCLDSPSEQTASIKILMGGYQGQYHNQLLKVLPQDKQSEFIRETITGFYDELDIVSQTVTTPELPETEFEQPVVLDAKARTSMFVEQAGDKYIFKVGRTIGPQVEMYDEGERKLPIEIEYPHRSTRHIYFEWPEGYILENLDQLNIAHVKMDDGDTTLKFTSSYEVEERKLHIYIDEFYDQLTWPLESYEDFREVINAAADFNKISLVLRREE